MGFFDHKHEKESPIGNLRAHIGTFMYFVKVGKSKFKNKGRLGEIFADMDNTQYLFQQATSGTMYDMKKKLDYALWDAAVHKYTEDLGELKKELLKAVDEGAETDTDVFEEKEEEVVEQPVQEEEEGDWKAHIKGQMEEAEEKARQEAERKRHEESTPASNKSDDDEHMTEADCRELWRIIQGLEREFREMNEIAEDWFSVHGKKDGCLGALAALALIPAAAFYGIFHIF